MNDLTRFVLILLFFWVVLAQVTAQLLMAPLGFGTAEDFSRIVEEMGRGEHLEMAFSYKILVLATNIVGLLFPALLFVALFRRGEVARFLRLDRLPKLGPAVWGVAAFLVSLPVVHFLYAANRWAMGSLVDDTERLGGLLHMESPADLAFTLLVLGVAPALFEELLYRGVLQRLLVERFPRWHLGLWIGALLFSSAHLDASGFLPRLALGAAFGWLVYRTGSLWVSIVLHTAFNSIQIVAHYFQSPDVQAVEQAALQPWDGVLWWVVGLSALGGFFLWKKTLSEE